MSKTIDVNNSNFESEVIKSELPVLVDFWAPWCGPCQMMAPVLEQLAEKFQGKLKVTKLNTEQEENQKLAWDYQIQSIPNMKLFKNGQVVHEFVGFRPLEMLTDEVEPLLK